MESLTILIADDDAPSREILAMFLEDSGHRVHTAADGAEAWLKLLELRPQLAILDANMPGMGGVDVARRVRDEPSLSDCRLIALSGHDVHDLQQHALFDRLFTKPVSPAALLAATRVGAGDGSDVRLPA